MITYTFLIAVGAALCSVASSEDALSCENDKLSLQCPAGKVLSIQSANYGRTSKEVCNGFLTIILTTNCKKDVKDKLVERCSGKESCSITASNGKFGNPCFGTFKYLEVSYECVPRHEAEYIRGISCENKEPLRLTCPENAKIEVIYGNYGRTDKGICPGLTGLNDDCFSETTSAMIKDDCNGKTECELYPTNGHFGDPCFLTYKYLDVKYKCVNAQEKWAVRLVNSEGQVVKNEGRLEVFVDGEWGTVSSKRLAKKGWANVMCLKLGYSKLVKHQFCSKKNCVDQSLSCAMVNPNCDENVSSLEDCITQEPTKGCNHSKDAWLECGN